MPITRVAQFTIDHLQILDEHGNLDAKLDPRLDEAEAVRLYEGMVRAREADQRMLKLQRQGRMGTFPLCTGQEAPPCGAALAMAEQDWFVGGYRELGGRLMRGASLLSYLRYWNGYEEGNVEPDKGRVTPIAAVVGSQVPHAVGIAYTMKLRREDAVVVTFFGDGATSEGDVLEAINFAGVWKLPLVFVCMNNQWAISVPTALQSGSETFAQKGLLGGVEGMQVDGNDPLACYRACKAAIDRARAGEGPYFIEALTYRLMMHTTADDPKRYRSEEEVQAWWKKDPIPRFRTYLERRGLWDAAREEALLERVRGELAALVRTFESESPIEKIDAPFDHIFGTRHAEIERQRAEFLAELQRQQEAADA